MRERGDCRVFHEPFLAYYYKYVSERQLALYDEKQVVQSDFDDIKQSLISAAENSAVFFKDMSYYVTPRIFGDSEFNQRLHHVFLIRDPRKSIPSFYKLDHDLSLEEIGLEAQWRHYCHLLESGSRAPLIIEAEKMAADPRTVIGQIWRFCDLPFVDSAFSWQSDATPTDWRYVEGWHTTAVASSSMVRDDSDPDQVFSQAAADAPALTAYLQHHMPFYEKLKAKAWTG